MNMNVRQFLIQCSYDDATASGAFTVAESGGVIKTVAGLEWSHGGKRERIPGRALGIQLYLSDNNRAL